MSTKSLLFATFLSSTALVPLAWTTPAQALHAHCDQNAWSSVITKTTIPLPQDYRPGGNAAGLNAFQFADIIPESPPPSLVPDCNYEISDITSIGITFWFEGAMSWNDKITIGGAGGVIYNLNPLNPTTFTSGIEKVFNLEPHQSNTPVPGPMELKLPYLQAFPVTLFGDNNGFKITDARLELQGNNYYVPVPGPLPFLGVGVAFRYSRKIRRRLASAQTFNN
jgi:hypothetical protein